MASEPQQRNAGFAADVLTANRVLLALGGVLCIYGLYSLLAGTAYLPGLWRARWAVTGADGRALSLAYIVVGLLLALRRPIFTEYAVGIGLAGLSALYGAYALLSGRTYLPGLRGGTTAVTGSHGRGVAIAYLVGGAFLFCRFFLGRLLHSDSSRTQLYFVQNLLLVALIGALVYVLLNVGTAG